MPRGRGAVVADVAAQLEAARHLPRMVAVDAAALRKIRRASEHEVEPFVASEDAGLAEISLPDLVAIDQAVVGGRSTREAHALRLRLDGHEPRARQTPGRDHPDRSD